MGELVPPGAHAQILDLPEGPIRVLRGGTGGTGRLPLLLLHGGRAEHGGISWYHAFEDFSAERVVIAVDLPGFGGSREAAALGGPEAMADFVVRVARELHIISAIVGGVSMGGDVAMNVALRHPEFTRALILVAPAGLAERAGNRLTHGATWLTTRRLGPLARINNRFSHRLIRSMAHDPESIALAVEGEFVRASRRPEAGVGFQQYCRATVGRTRLRNNLADRVGQITAPALFFHGAEDRQVSPQGPVAAVEDMPDARLVLVPEVGHWAQLEAPEEFQRTVRDFLDSLHI